MEQGPICVHVNSLATATRIGTDLLVAASDQRNKSVTQLAPMSYRASHAAIAGGNKRPKAGGITGRLALSCGSRAHCGVGIVPSQAWVQVQT